MANHVNQTRIQHLYLRAGFGEKASVIQADAQKSVKAVVKKLLKDSHTFVPLKVVESAPMSRQELKAMAGKDKEDIREEVRMLAKESKQQIRELNLRWLERMSHGPDAFRQKMSLFWHGHFACKSGNAFFMQQYLHTLQQHALGNFGELLHSVSKSPAMLQFLNNQQNRKDSPNENFAREVMELFTLGRGNYTEADIKQASRAFTGWGFSPEGEYVFRQPQHDADAKTFFGKTGNWKGEDILDMILKRKETALFVSRKIYRYFVNEQVDEKRVTVLADRFYKSGYDIKDLMEFILSSDWFYDAANIGVRIKSPLELIAGLTKTLDIQFEEKESWLYLQKVLGQVALHPPNVAGWPEGRNWIDSSSLIFRMKLPEAIFKASEVATLPKDEGDADTNDPSMRQTRRLQAKINWEGYQTAFAAYPEKEIIDRMAAYLLPVPLSGAQKTLVEKQAGSSANREEFIRNVTLSLLTLPEYQLC